MMKSGTYYVGDLCYVIPHDQWVNEVCEIFFANKNRDEGEFTLNDGTPFAMYGTANGDGYFNGCYVDSGTIGCIDLEYAVSLGHISRERMAELGLIETFKRDFDTCYDDGMIKFANLVIETDPAHCGMCGNRAERWEIERYGECAYCHEESQREDEDEDVA